MDIFFRQWWTDPRLAHNFSTPFNMAGDATKLIWTPDTFFWNVKAAKYHKVTRENMRIKIHGDGKVYFSTRYTFYVKENQTRPQLLKGWTDLPGGRISFHKIRTIKTF